MQGLVLDLHCSNSKHLLALNLTKSVVELSLEPRTQDVVKVFGLGGLLRVAPVGKSVDDGAALAQLAEDNLPAQRLLHVLVELKEPNLHGLHRNVEGGVFGRRGGER